VWANSGYGLFMTQRLCSLGGEFTFISGTSGLRTTEEEFEELNTHSPGTTVVMQLNCAEIANLSARLQDFRKEGLEIAKQLGGANQFGASLASQVLQPRKH
jgi:hypothetical protein